MYVCETDLACAWRHRYLPMIDTDMRLSLSLLWSSKHNIESMYACRNTGGMQSSGTRFPPLRPGTCQTN